MVSRVTIVLLLLTACQLADAQNFVAYQSGERTQEVVDRAAQCRKEIAIAWFGEELPNWERPCQLTYRVTDGRGSGVTMYDQGTGRPRSMTTHVEGSWERIINDVMPHEVLHLVLRDYAGFAMPRWMDEGAASTAESDESITFLETKLREYFAQGRVPPVNVMLLATEYPRDVHPFYCQGVSLSRFLLGKRGVAEFVRLANIHRQTNSWTDSFREVYGYESLQAMQNDWLAWVSKGCPEFPPDTVSMKAIPRAQAPYRPMGDTPVSAEQFCATGQCDGSCPTSPMPPGQIQPSPSPSSGSTPERVIRVQVEYDKIAAELAKNPKIRGEDGKDGKDGADGVGIDRLKRNSDDTLDVIYTNQVVHHLGKLPQGPPGEVSDEQIQAIVDKLKSEPVKLTEANIKQLTVQLASNGDLLKALLKALQEAGCCNTLEGHEGQSAPSLPRIYWDVE